MTTEHRTFSLDNVEVRADDDGKKTIVGHAAVFDSLSENLGGFREKIQQGAFDDVLSDDVRALFNHDRNQVLGRTTSGTLRISVDDTGLKYEIDTPDTQVARDLTVLMQRGDVNQSSFGFVVDQDKWEEDDDGRVVRTITKLRRLLDVSPVTYPAYPDTDVAVRSMEQWKTDNQPTPPDFDIQKRRIQLAEIELKEES